ncbi:MAG: cyanophycin synthetase, partial [Methylibium sp.]
MPHGMRPGAWCQGAGRAHKRASVLCCPGASSPPKMSKKNDLQLLRINYLRGPNIWTYRPVLETWLDLGELEDHPSHLLPGF